MELDFHLSHTQDFSKGGNEGLALCAEAVLGAQNRWQPIHPSRKTSSVLYLLLC
jgi:hypothetical protein